MRHDEELKVMQACLEQLLRLDSAGRKRARAWLDDKLAAPEAAKPSPICQHIGSREFLALRTDQARYLALVALLCRLHSRPVEFLDIAEEQQGRTRKNFSADPRVIEESGSGAKAVAVRFAGRATPPLPLYANVNNSTPAKKEILRKLMAKLGYPEEDISVATDAISSHR